MNTILTPTDFAALSPLFFLLGGALIVLLLESFAEQWSKKYSFYITIATFLAALVTSYKSPLSQNPLLTMWLSYDSFAQFFTIFFLLIGIASACLAKAFFKKFDATHGEYYFLLISAVVGLILIATSADFLTLFLGIETLSISLYILCGYMKKWSLSHESAIKYFLLGSLGAAFLLYGIALIYGGVGSTSFSTLLNSYHALQVTQDKMLFLSGIAFVTVGLAFKAAIVPFHVWAPDVYGGAPTPVTAFMAVGTKIGAFAAFARIFLISLPQFDPIWNEGISLLAYPTLIYANFVALKQTRMRRFFAYSGISHAGFLLIPLAVGTEAVLPAFNFYLVVYACATLGAFAVLAFLDKGSEGIKLHDLNGLFYRSPLLAGALTLCLLTLAGFPPTAGFLAKFYIFKAAFQAGYYPLVVVALLTTVLAAYYYLRIVSAMLSEAPEEEGVPKASKYASIVGALSVAAILALSIYPTPLLDYLGAWF